MTELTQEALKSVLHYSPETGLFTYLVDHKRHKAGDIANGKTDAGYIQVSVFAKKYYAHRLAFFYMTGAFPDALVDHINRVTADNRWSNLRPATPAQNTFNSRLRKDNTSGYRGVCKSGNEFSAYVTFERKRHYLGNYSTAKEAGDVAAAARLKFYGEFAGPTTTTKGA